MLTCCNSTPTLKKVSFIKQPSWGYLFFFPTGLVFSLIPVNYEANNEVKGWKRRTLATSKVLGDTKHNLTRCVVSFTIQVVWTRSYIHCALKINRCKSVLPHLRGCIAIKPFWTVYTTYMPSRFRKFRWHGTIPVKKKKKSMDRSVNVLYVK